MNIFVTAISNNSGKTVFSSGITGVMQSLGYEMAVFKPIQTGCKYANDKQFSPDLNFVKKIDPNIKTYSTYNFKLNSLPAIAADSERMKFSLDKVIRDYNEIKKENDIVVIEGSGGLLCPITARYTMADLALALKTPIIIVVNAEGDFVNQTLLTIKAAEIYRLEILGLVLNKYNPNAKNEKHHHEVQLLEQSIEYDILGSLPNLDIMGEGINPENLISEVLQNVNLPRVFNMEIPKLLF